MERNKKEAFKLIGSYINIGAKDFNRSTSIPIFSSEKCKEYKFSEGGKGLKLNVLNFYLNNLENKSIPKNQYCACREFENGECASGNKICYSEKCIPVIEKCVYGLDLFKAAMMGITTAENQIRQIKKYRKLNKHGEISIFDRYVRVAIQKRKKMWQEINEGIGRLLKGRAREGAQILSETDADMEGMRFKGRQNLMLHGHQFKDWKNRNVYWKFFEKPKTISLAHYHIMLPMFKFNTLIIFNGHLSSGYETILDDYYFSHVGAVSLIEKGGVVKRVNFMRIE